LGRKTRVPREEQKSIYKIPIILLWYIAFIVPFNTMPEVFENIFHPHKNKKPVFLNSSYSDSIYEKL